MKLVTVLHLVFARWIWNPMPRFMQHGISRAWGWFFSRSISKPFVYFFESRYAMRDELKRTYQSASGEKTYGSFQDFFTRKRIQAVTVDGFAGWPCQGYVCDSGSFAKMQSVHVKGQRMDARAVFGDEHSEMTDSASFFNIFLHNHNYHRVHSPVSGWIQKIEKITGDLLLLRPWLYGKNEVSAPAIRNERMILKIKDMLGAIWFLVCVGGMGVGNITLADGMDVGEFVTAGQELALFLLGSTVCMSIPYPMSRDVAFLESVDVGQTLPIINSSQKNSSPWPKKSPDKKAKNATGPIAPILETRRILGSPSATL